MLLYLHGFASSPQSTKARFFQEHFAAEGRRLEILDLAPDFTGMTVTSMLGVVDGQLDRAPAVLLGSSLGGYLAALAAARRPDRVRAIVLMAPAFGFCERWEAKAGPEVMARWRRKGTARVYHWARRREEPLSIALLDDGRRYPATPDPTCPALVLAGRRDESVPLAVVEPFVQARPDRRELVVFDAGHELTEVLDALWMRTSTFLAGLPDAD